MLTEETKSQSGFTIVEVMIVLAIAGLVLAIVFIAVPALQRNSRNTQRRADLANFRAQFDTWTSNNNGKLPGDALTTDGFGSIVNSTGWGHYKGNLNFPQTIILGATTAAHCTPGSPAETPLPTALGDCEDGADNVASNSDDGVWTPATTTNTSEYQVGYVRDRDPSTGTVVEYPDRQEIHIFGEMACGQEILTGGNDTDDSGGSQYASGDIVASNARALTFVYQVEGEDRARCEDNV